VHPALRAAHSSSTQARDLLRPQLLAKYAPADALAAVVKEEVSFDMFAAAMKQPSQVRGGSDMQPG
jgi:hypothetical protein